jgi:aryl-alcohol dehydrogenase-like predicted oxidoreductase
MQRRPFGQSGLDVSVLGFGAMQAGDPRLPEAHVARLLNHALDLGLTLIDTARSYGISEERIGRHLAGRRSEYLLSTKLGYGAEGIPDWTYESVVAGVEAACNRLQTDVIDIVHLHSCTLELLEEGEVVRALEDCRDAGKLRIAAYSGDSAALRYAIACGAFGSVQASVNLCDQEALRALREASDCGLGTIAKRPLAGQPWRAREPSQEPVHREYARRFDLLRAEPGFDADDMEALTLRFAAFSPNVDCAIVGGTDPGHLEKNVTAVKAGPLERARYEAIRAAFQKVGSGWPGLV